MNVADLAEKIAAEYELPKPRAKQILDTAFALLGDAIAHGEDIAIPGFGKFKVTDRPAREGRNPATGQPMQIAASRKAAFAPAKQLKDKLAKTEA